MDSACNWLHNSNALALLSSILMGLLFTAQEIRKKKNNTKQKPERNDILGLPPATLTKAVYGNHCNNLSEYFVSLLMFKVWSWTFSDLKLVATIISCNLRHTAELDMWFPYAFFVSSGERNRKSRWKLTWS